MISTPYLFEPSLSDQEFMKIGHLSVKWSHLEHIIGNCLKVILRLNDDEARIVVFPLSLEQRMVRIGELAEIGSLSERSQRLFRELKAILKGIQYVRNNVIHAIVESGEGGTHFICVPKTGRLQKIRFSARTKLRIMPPMSSRRFGLALAFKMDSTLDYTLPDRPDIPEFLRSLIQFPSDQ